MAREVGLRSGGRSIGDGLSQLSGAEGRAAEIGRRRSLAMRAARMASLAAVPTLLLAPGLAVGPSVDAAAFVVGGRLVRGGAIPYRDFWDHKPPAVYLLNAASEAILPFADPWFVAWLLSVVFTVAAVLVFDRVFRSRTSAVRSWFFSLALGLLVSAYPIALGGGHTETFALLPLSGAVALVALRPSSLRRTWVVGLLLGIACLFSMLAAPGALAVGLAAVWRVKGTASDGAAAVRGTGLGRGWRGGALLFVALLIGALAFPLAAALWLLLTGAMPDAFDQLVTYTSAYRQSSGGLGVSVLAPVLVAAFLVPLAALGLARLRSRDASTNRLGWISVVWLVAAVAAVGLEGRIFLHYAILFLPPVVLLAADGSRWLATWPSRRGMFWSAGTVAILGGTGGLLVLSCVCLVTWGATAFDQAAAWRPVAQGLADTVRASTPSGATLFVWTDNPELYLLSDRAPAGPFIYQFPMVTPGYWSPARTASLLESWRSSPPSAVVEGDTGISLDVNADAAPSGPASAPGGDGRTYDTLDPLRAFVHERYHVAGEVSGYRVYVLDGLGASAP